MSFYDRDDAPTTLQDISNTLRDYAVYVARDIRVLRVKLDDAEKKTDASTDIQRFETDSLWIKVEDELQSLRYLTDRLWEISYAFDIINRTVYNPSEERK